jgi:hypothetical protein
MPAVGEPNVRGRNRRNRERCDEHLELPTGERRGLSIALLKASSHQLRTRGFSTNVPGYSTYRAVTRWLDSSNLCNAFQSRSCPTRITQPKLMQGSSRRDERARPAIHLAMCPPTGETREKTNSHLRSREDKRFHSTPARNAVVLTTRC